MKSINKPDNLPKNPSQYYKDEYIGINDYLGNEKPDKRYNYGLWMNFNEARAFVRTLELKGIKEWNLYTNGKISRLTKNSLPRNIPKDPRNTYKNLGWKGVRDWVGTDK